MGNNYEYDVAEQICKKYPYFQQLKKIGLENISKMICDGVKGSLTGGRAMYSPPCGPHLFLIDDDINNYIDYYIMMDRIIQKLLIKLI